MGLLMLVGWYTPYFESSVSPWTTLGPLALVISISLAQEGAADMKRHRSDRETNNFACVVLRREDDVERGAERDNNIMDGKPVRVTLQTTTHAPIRKSMKTVIEPPLKSVNIIFASVKRMDMRAGDIVLVKNREMVPADIILLGSSGENGAAYIETSPIDGETNLKLRTCPQLPLEALESVSTPRAIGKKYTHPKFETIERAVKRVTRFSLLGYPDGISAAKNPKNPLSLEDPLNQTIPTNRTRSFGRSPSMDEEFTVIDDSSTFITSLTSEAPNASVNTFSGKITLPPHSNDKASTNIPLGAENILLRGSVLRNTEWAIGVACFTGADTKLARNSVKTPSKFSRLDVLMNRTVVVILVIMLICVVGLALLADVRHRKSFDYMWYAGFHKEGIKWPYLPDDFEAPKWKRSSPSIFSFIFTFFTLLNNFVPLSLYVTVEMITLFMMLLIGWDKDMYHEDTDTPAASRSTIVTDLGLVKYVFSDKTGTLTQNVMKFKRCSVDGLAFGAPIAKASPGASDGNGIDESKLNASSVFHPLKRLFVGSVTLERVEEGNDGISVEVSSTSNAPRASADSNGFMTFNAEMFLRVMSICHTVVVEKEIDTSNINIKSDDSSTGISSVLKKWNRSRNNSEEVTLKKLGTVIETNQIVDDESTLGSLRTPFPVPKDITDSAHSLYSTEKYGKNKDGAPAGYAFQAESPDEGALVTAASNEYNFQLIGRDSDGVKLSTSTPSLLAVRKVTNDLKSGSLSAQRLAAETASPITIDLNTSTLKKHLSSVESKMVLEYGGRCEETWQILAVNKFDSDRKRMSVVVRSPPNLGSMLMLLCKGADSSMLDPQVCEGGMHMMSGDGLGQSLSSLGNDEDNGEDWESSTLLGMQSHLGIFASEGLRTLVLGIRILTEAECTDWLVTYEKAAASITDRGRLLEAAAKEIESRIHIVGATAIEDKLQDGVPETIYNIGRAGIKLWVLTGDKRETAIEIGYSAKVLNPKMHLTDVADSSEKRVKALVAMEFMRLVKMGKLPQYQKNVLEQPEKQSLFVSFFKGLGSFLVRCSRSWRRFYHMYIRTVFGLFFRDRARFELAKIDDEIKQVESNKSKYKEVRDLAERLLEEYLNSREGLEELGHRRQSSAIRVDSNDFDGGGNTIPAVFSRAQSARNSINMRDGVLTQSVLRSLTIGSVTADTIRSRAAPVVDEDTLSLMSFVPGRSGNVDVIFNKKKRTMLERMFAVDRDVRKGNLVKHLTKQKKAEYYSNFNILPQDSAKDVPDGVNANIDRALVIEGSALAHFLVDPLLEELLFSVASNCESVIACRVSPKQKALLVKLVKQFVQPEPVTLAIGDGANDVGMIQEAQVGIGISGLEGQQAVNASDFSIAQFRFLENLLLTHGRWNFIRLSKTVLFSFYKNAVLAGLLMAYCRVSFYSGTPLFDMWVLSAFNFVCAWPILLLGMFDRDLEKDYVKKNPHLYAAGPNNEHMSLRVTFRWITLVFLHVNVIYYICAAALDSGGATTSAFKGLMSFGDREPGDGDGSGIKVFGTTTFMILNWTLGLKVLYESGSIIVGKWPACTCRENVGEGFWSRVSYTWYGLIYLSILFNLFFVYTYQYIGRDGASSFSPFFMVTDHMLHTRAITWVVIPMVTIAATSVDVIGKVFGNMFYPTQTQIHKEIQHINMKEEKRETMRRSVLDNLA